MSQPIQPVQPAIQPNEASERLTERSPEWVLWFGSLLMDRGYAAQDNAGGWHLRVRKLERAIAAALPAEHAVPYATLSDVMRFRVVPKHATARGLAAALRVPELAILLMSGQLDKAAIAPLIGSEPAILRTEDDYRAALARLEQEIPDPAFRRGIAELLDREWRYSQWLRAQLDTFGISEAEWLAMRDFLNTPSGRDALRRAITGEARGEDGGDSDGGDEPYIPDEFLRAEQGD